MRKAHNIMEDIVTSHLDGLLASRDDLCRCKRCRDDLFSMVLNKVPARYVTSETGAMHALIEQVNVEESSLILREIINAIRVVGNNPHHQGGEDRDKAYALLMRQIKLDRGVDFSQYRERVLQRRIAVRMRERSVNTYSDYLQILIHSADEYEKLFDVLTINVSAFFRDLYVWEKLNKDIFPQLIQSKQRNTRELDRRVRVWSAGCSHGEEPYSLAILFFEILEHAHTNVRAEIIATDIDKACLAQAKSGKYNREALRNVNAGRFKRFFLPVGEEFLVVPHVRQLVSFHERNLIHDPGVSNVDVVFCRNVFIYFNRSLQEHLIMKYYNALVDGGYFIMGNSETLLGEARQLFEEIDADCRIYRKIPQHT